MTKDIGFMPETDGVDHINIYSKGKTALGQVLSNFWMCEIQTEDGTFWSVEAYWAWLSVNELCNKRNDLRAKMSGWSAKQMGHQLVTKYGKRFEPRFEEKIMGAIHYKINQFKPLIKPFIKDLPFVHYYCWGNPGKDYKKVDVTAKYQWMVDGIREYCMQILEEKEIKQEIELAKEANKAMLPVEKIVKLKDAYEGNKENLRQVRKDIKDYGRLDNGVSDVEDTFEMGYNNALEYVFSILGIEYKPYNYK